MPYPLIAVPVYHNSGFIIESLPSLNKISHADILIVDDGSDEEIPALVGDLPGIRSVSHGLHLGSGAAFITCFQYARDFGYETMITIDPCNPGFMEDIEALRENLTYGFDIVSCSRILENYDHECIPAGRIEIAEKISAALSEATGCDITDPFSGTKGMRMESIKDMDFTEFSHAVHIQLFIQAAYFGLSVFEIPSHSGKNFCAELDEYDDPLSFFLSRIETEKYLYRKGTAN